MQANKPVIAIKTEVFEGPLDLLIELVEKRKLLINDISLTAVTNEYLETVRRIEDSSLLNTAHFLSLAATLLLIKSKSLLPNLTLTEEEEENIDDLEQRLKHYQLYKQIAVTLNARITTSRLYTRRFIPSHQPIFTPDKHCKIEILSEIMLDITKRLPKFKTKSQTAKLKPTITLENVIGNLKTRIEKQFKINFSELSSTKREKGDTIINFLALLELFKQGEVLLLQNKPFSDISISSNKINITKRH